MCVAGKERQIALDEFYEEWKEDSLVILKWLGLQTASNVKGNLHNVQQLLKHPAVNITNPNTCYSVFLGFARSPVNFHAEDGSGYTFMADSTLQVSMLGCRTAVDVLWDKNSSMDLSEVKRMWQIGSAVTLLQIAAVLTVMICLHAGCLQVQHQIPCSRSGSQQMSASALYICTACLERVAAVGSDEQSAHAACLVLWHCLNGNYYRALTIAYSCRQISCFLCCCGCTLREHNLEDLTWKSVPADRHVSFPCRWTRSTAKLRQDWCLVSPAGGN